MTEARAAAGQPMRGQGPARRGTAAYAAGQAAAVRTSPRTTRRAAYAIKAARAAAPRAGTKTRATRVPWQRDQLPEAIRALVLVDQRLRTHLLVGVRL